ncbi:MAG: T9SS type A sorting domain-containing protein [Prevotellaceae bacterium]|nr:T9SS type A sorting domain-containing protein [Prevotellaceae bacterium]
MKKYLLFFFLFAAASASAHIVTETEEQAFTSVQPTPQISVNGGNIRIQGANGLCLEIYDITGKRIYSQQLDSPDKTVSPELPKGIYIVRIGKYTRKLALN